MNRSTLHEKGGQQSEQGFDSWGTDFIQYEVLRMGGDKRRQCLGAGFYGIFESHPPTQKCLVQLHE
jgi:hypothetical protein